MVHVLLIFFADFRNLKSSLSEDNIPVHVLDDFNDYMTVGLLLLVSFGFCAWGGGGLVWVCACRNATLLEVTCHGSRFYYPILLYICALEIFAVKTTSLSKVLLYFSPFRFRAPTCQQDVITLQLRLCRTVFFP